MPPVEPLCHYLKADLNDGNYRRVALGAARYSGTRRPFELADAVVHLAGIPAPGLAPDATTFQNNLMTTYNVFSAATMLVSSGWCGRRVDIGMVNSVYQP